MNFTMNYSLSMGTLGRLGRVGGGVCMRMYAGRDKRVRVVGCAGIMVIRL